VTGGIVDAGTLHQRPASDAEATGRSPPVRSRPTTTRSSAVWR